MELRINIDYQHILSLIQQLPVKDIEKLSTTMQTEIISKKKNGKKNLRELLLSAPTWTETDYKRYQEFRRHINSTRLK